VNVLSLFSGIGGLELGLERAGMTVVGQVEIDPFCRQVLAKHWPEVPRHDDVRTAVQWWRAGPRPDVDLICGGFPCQPFSTAGQQRGASDPRWEWPAFSACLRALRPRYALLENVPALLRHTAAFGRILADLAECGFDASWSVLSACSMGAPHTRERLFVLAYPQGQWLGQHRWLEHQPGGAERHLHHWESQPEPHRVADGVARRVDRLRVIGNAVVPQVAEHVGRLVMGAAA
jgi:DNA (cytosine-5)-methyltransferase 1